MLDLDVAKVSAQNVADSVRIGDQLQFAEFLCQLAGRLVNNARMYHELLGASYDPPGSEDDRR